MEPMASSSEGSAEQAGATPSMPPLGATNIAFDQKDIDENKFVAALSYLGLLFLVPLLVKKDSAFAQFHAKQGLVLCIAFVILSFIPFLGWLGCVVLFIVSVIALINTLSGKAWEIPLVKDLVKKINI